MAFNDARVGDSLRESHHAVRMGIWQFGEKEQSELLQSAADLDGNLDRDFGAVLCGGSGRRDSWNELKRGRGALKKSIPAVFICTTVRRHHREGSVLYP